MQSAWPSATTTELGMSVESRFARRARAPPGDVPRSDDRCGVPTCRGPPRAASRVRALPKGPELAAMDHGGALAGICRGAFSGATRLATTLGRREAVPPRAASGGPRLSRGNLNPGSASPLARCGRWAALGRCHRLVAGLRSGYSAPGGLAQRKELHGHMSSHPRTRCTPSRARSCGWTTRTT